MGSQIADHDGIEGLHDMGLGKMACNQLAGGGSTCVYLCNRPIARGVIVCQVDKRFSRKWQSLHAFQGMQWDRKHYDVAKNCGIFA
jgi:hypothetical protein